MTISNSVGETRHMKNTRQLLMSNSRNAGQDYLEHAATVIADFLGKNIRSALFIPYASVVRPFEEYESVVRSRFSSMGYNLTSIHRAVDPKDAVVNAKAIVIGGGNTFHLLRRLYDADLLEAIRQRVGNGTPYIGWSAGSNVACPTIRTTNDMPIVEPPSLKALGLVPFQINPHYLDTHPEGHQGETRAERILEFIEVNRDVPVVGLREGSMLKVEGENIELLGPKTARIFRSGSQPAELAPGRIDPSALSTI
jgi:dipeptidase E